MKDGTQFVSTREEAEPQTIKLGHRELFTGLDDGISTMKKGELALFTLLLKPGHGDLGVRWSIPPGSEVQFEVELVSWLTVVDVSKDGGIVKKILVGGDDVQTGDLDEVQVKYQVRLVDGSLLVESPEEGLWFHINEGHLLPAFTKAVKTMKRGEKAVVTVQPQLVIDIDLLSLKPVLDVTGDMKVLKKILRAGEGIRRPNNGETVYIRYTALLEDGTLFEKVGFDDKLFEFAVDEEEVIAGLDRAVATMLKGEISQIMVKREYGFMNDHVDRIGINVPAYSTLVYEVELVDFTKEKELWEMSNHEKIGAAENAKQMGNDLYKIGKFSRAAKKYDKAVSYINENGSFEDGDDKLVRTLRVSCWLNHAACSLKLKDFKETIQLCSKVLDIEFCNLKALYRRGQAYMAAGHLDLAKLDIQKALEVDPQNREVKSLELSLRKEQRESSKRDAKLYANMFERMRKDADKSLKRFANWHAIMFMIHYQYRTIDCSVKL
ncbi:uncharacterized protein A4U43_C08F15240 [Asparagus officinalis]|nr:uncharacterized protein A4U43_C08F15240 [Asparagus officinalis]